LARSSDVDALGMLTLCVKWTELHGHRWGLQTLGALLFWFPRQLWPDKPIGTGTMVTEGLGFEFTNLSPPIVAQGYVDIGFVGVALMSVAVGWLFSRIDLTYFAHGNPRRRPRRVIDLMYPFWVASVVFVTRGDMMAAAAHTAAFTLWIVPFALGVRSVARSQPHAIVQPAPALGGSG
jgi:hypothetical protein